MVQLSGRSQVPLGDDAVAINLLFAIDWTRWGTLIEVRETKAYQALSEPVPKVRFSRTRVANLSQTIFVLEDEADISRLVQYHLESAGYTVKAYMAIAQIVSDAERQPPSLFLLDIMVPGGDGLDLCRRLRQNPNLSSIPIIFLTARAAENDRVHGLELGADDYITKPFATRELVARVKAVLRRFERPTAPSMLKFENIEIDASAMQLRVSGELVTTTATEFRLLDYLARHPGRVFSRDHLLDAVWGDARFVTPRSVDVYVRRIREKIEADAETPRYLKTMRGAGYRFEIPKSIPA
jgi:two-component system phosphate regulon response regulator PhoB